jgi:serpin B
VNQSTGGKTDRIVETITSDQMLFLIDAIYFKGKWTQEFNKKQTAEYPFYLAAGRQKQHPMMSQSGEYRYYENEKFQAVSLPYGENKRLSLYIFLPVKNSSLSAFYKTLNAQNWEKWMTRFRSREGFIRLPRFKMQYDIELKDALAALGMGVAFSDNANFSGISDNNLLIDEVKHKTFVEVNEEGTEAAAVTAVTLAPPSAVINLEEPFRMIVDRPFFCAIRDNQTGTVMFMGSIVEPQSN